MCLSTRIEAPMGADNQVNFVVIWPKDLLFVCLSAMIDTPMGISNWN